MLLSPLPSSQQLLVLAVLSRTLVIRSLYASRLILARSENPDYPHHHQLPFFSLAQISLNRRIFSLRRVQLRRGELVGRNHVVKCGPPPFPSLWIARTVSLHRDNFATPHRSIMNADSARGVQPLFPTAISAQLHHQEMIASLRPSPLVSHNA